MAPAFPSSVSALGSDPVVSTPVTVDEFVPATESTDVSPSSAVPILSPEGILAEYVSSTDNELKSLAESRDLLTSRLDSLETLLVFLMVLFMLYNLFRLIASIYFDVKEGKACSAPTSENTNARIESLATAVVDREQVDFSKEPEQMEKKDDTVTGLPAKPQPGFVTPLRSKRVLFW